jgi:protein arginine kinase
MEKSEKLPKVFTSKLPWSEATDSIWPASSIELRRNLESHNFPSKLTQVHAKEVLSRISLKLPPFQTLLLSSLPIHDKEILFEHFFLSEGFERQDDGRAFFVDDSGVFLGSINLEDHLHLHSLTFDQNLDSPWKLLSNLEKKLSKVLGFSYSPRFGYHTSNFSVCGTGLLVQAFLHLPALLHLEKFSPLVESLPDDLILKGLGQEGEYLADFVLIQNKYTLGVSEGSILNSIETTAKNYSQAEAQVRKDLNTEETNLLKDKIGRSFGLVSNAFSLEVGEGLSALSLIHLGKELGWIKKASSFNFFNLFFSSRRAHLAEETKNEHLIKEYLPLARAHHLRKVISLLDPAKLFL